MVRRAGAWVAAVSASLLLASACTGGGGLQASRQRPLRYPVGGTLRVGLLDTGVNNLDPQSASGIANVMELARCCLFRTLLSYNGQPTSGDGTTLRPDVAVSLPTVSSNGLTWTFHLRHGLHYAPPLQHVEITAQDFVRSLDRMLGPEANTVFSYFPNFFRAVLAGAGPYMDGKASEISGLEAPDRYTVRVHLTSPNGDLGYLLATWMAFPIPPNPSDPGARLGVAEGHDADYSNYLVASGPYMIAGSPNLDFSKPAVEQPPLSGITGSTVTLVRNPSWTRASDDLRKAYADRIVLSAVTNEKAAEHLVESGRLDVVMDWQAPADLVKHYQSTPGLGSRVFATQADQLQQMDLNPAMAPFDDVHVRRAANYAIDKAAIAFSVERTGTPVSVMTHIGFDSEEGNLLTAYDPYHTDEARGSVERARAEMARSAYDRNHDGVCDAPACRDVALYTDADRANDPSVSRMIARNLVAIGLHVHVVEKPTSYYFNPAGLRARRALTFAGGWSKDYPSAATTLATLFDSRGIPPNCCDSSLLGATPQQLRRLGYRVTQVPSADDRIRLCVSLQFGARVRCWAALDRYLMQEVVPWVPMYQNLTARIVSARVAHFSFDQAAPIPTPALDQIALTSAAAGSPAGPIASRSPSPTSPASSIPNGTYRVTITEADAAKVFRDDDVAQTAGTYTLTLDAGRWRWTKTGGSESYWHPTSWGTYTGSGQRITFRYGTDAFSEGYAVNGAWALSGGSLGIRIVSAAYPVRFERYPWGVHPWQLVGTP